MKSRKQFNALRSALAILAFECPVGPTTTLKHLLFRAAPVAPVRSMESGRDARLARAGRLCMLFGLVVFLFLLGTPPARAASTPVTTCGQVLSAAGDYQLTGDLGPCSGDGVVIAASHVNLNLAGHTISGMNPPSVCNSQTTSATQTGIRIAAASNVNVNGGAVTGFVYGIDLVGAPSSLIEFTVTAMTVTGNCDFGIGVLYAHNSLIATSVVTGNGVDGIELVAQAVAGVCAPCVQNITIEYNDVSSNPRFGILNEGNNMVIRDNIVNHNAAMGTGAGIAIFGIYAKNNTIDHNAVNYNKGPSGFGIVLENDAQGNIVKGNTANGNVVGIDAQLNSLSNTFNENITHGNSIHDLEDDNHACGSNTWKSNNFDTASVGGGPNPGCIH